MGRLNEGVPIRVNQFCLGLGRLAPQDEDAMFGPRSQQANHSVGKFFPAALLVRVGLVGFHGQDSVEQQDTAFAPRLQVSRIRNRNAKIGLEFLEDVLERGWMFNTGLHRKGQAMSLALVMVRVLTEDDGFDLGKGSQAKSVEDLIVSRKNGGRCSGSIDKRFEFAKVVFFELGFEQRFPASGYLFVHDLAFFNSG